MQLFLKLAAFAAAAIAITSGAAHAQAAGKPPATLTENELKEVLVWNSPWEGRAAAPGQNYSYRSTFRARRDTLVVEVVSYATNQRADSVVTMRDGKLTWQDSNGADVSVALAEPGNLVGVASTRETDLPIVLSPRR